MLSFCCPFSRKTVRVNLLVTFQTKRFGFTSGRYSTFSRLSDSWLLWVKYFTGKWKKWFFFLQRMVFLARFLGYASCSCPFCCLPHPASDNSTWTISSLPYICSIQISKGGLHRCKFQQIKLLIFKDNLFSQFLEEEPRRATLDSQLEAGGFLCKPVTINKQALRNSCELLRRRKELHARSGNCMQGRVTVCKLM